MRLNLNDPREYCEFHARQLSKESGHQFIIFRGGVDEHGEQWFHTYDNDCPPMPYVEGCLIYTVKESANV